MMRPRVNRYPLVRKPQLFRGRGLTLIELMLAMTISVMIAGAMSGMVSAVTAGVTSRQDTREVMIRSSAANTKLAAYVNPARAIWGTDASTVALWFNDSREGGGIHVTEVRWLIYDAANDAVEVHFVKFPDDWSQVAKDIEDVEYSKTQTFAAMYAKYSAGGHMAKLRLLDNVEDFSFKLDNATALDAQRITFTLTLTGSDGPQVITVTATLAHHQPPEH